MTEHTQHLTYLLLNINEPIIHCNHTMPYIKWIYVCIILHNMLTEFSDSWEVMCAEGDLNVDLGISWIVF
ncbi:hypothetical protein VP01_6g8 [Puccinia sorghi]|uniref:Uncharacterized protein n=1 Tax=Puccinia sorghi TaxID=27349 RepID=A0A0L6UDY6_9BASI|nr:hypothetical protein VP01_6g8 [Puccinia sorghi]